jgi:hypothetical protein
MSPAASQFIVTGQEVLPIVATGSLPPTLLPDGFASDVSLEAICIAPDSDVDIMSVQYADPAVPGAVTNTLVGLGAPFVSQINAKTGVNGKIVFGTPRAFIDPGALAFFAADPLGVIPKLKAFGYFQKPSVLPIVRADVFGTVIHGITTGAEEIVMNRAFYGRRLLYINILGALLSVPTTVRVKGFNFGGIPSATTLFTTVLPAAPTSQAEFGMSNKFYDAIQITVLGAAGPPDTVRVDFTFADAL